MDSHCRLCERDQVLPRFSVRGIWVDHCPGCGFVQVREQPTEEDLVKLYGEPYFDRGKYSDPFALRKENERRLALLTGCGLPPAAKVLDAGCATGDFVAFAQSRFDMWGLDVSEFAVEEARRKAPAVAHQLHAGFVEQQNYGEAMFDAIVLWDVLEHLWDPVTVCRSLLRALRPGGFFVVSTPNIGAPVARLMKTRWAFMTVPEHLGFFDHRTMRFLLQDRLGLQCLDWRTKGKWANLGFLFYKLNRVFPGWVPNSLIRLLRSGPAAKLSVYVPTGDIQYAVSRKSP
ncbi:MAG TPA: class I SAM-dependent methyltransferase [Phycisphaerae bacterium]|nr:class I SAM-dependent methyltransferase [Phycisphaerae bacterium]